LAEILSGAFFFGAMLSIKDPPGDLTEILNPKSIIAGILE